MRDDVPLNRRRFFREGLRELLKPLAKAAEPIARAMHDLGALDDSAPKATPYEHRAWLRPPGALEEQLFRETCSRCMACVRVCPAQCIKIDVTGVKGAGAPYIEPSEMPCVVCDGLKCMHECPTGALVPTLLA